MQISKMNLRNINKFTRLIRKLSQIQTKQVIKQCPEYMEFCGALVVDSPQAQDIIRSMTIHNDFLNEIEETSIFEEIDPYMRQLKYEFDHWDDAIHGYRETERLKWNEANTKILDRVREIAFPSGVMPLKLVHILDLDCKGHIKPHIDAVRFCGDTIAGLSLLTDSVMRLVHNKNQDWFVNIYLRRRSLYIMKGVSRFDYTHEILCNDASIFKNEKIFKDRRISVICRNEPDPKNQKL